MISKLLIELYVTIKIELYKLLLRQKQ